jgi:lysophospholipase L1-like esterase
MMKTTHWFLAALLVLLCACNMTVGISSTPTADSVIGESPASQGGTSTDNQSSSEEPTPADEAPTDQAGSPPVNTGPLPAGALTIVNLGDSLTQGDGDESGQGGFPSRLQTLVEEVRAGSQALNLGKSGWSSIDLINGLNGEPSQLEQALAANPQIATVWIGSNDLWYLYEYGPDPITAEAEQSDLQTYETNIDTILSRLTGAGAKVFIALLDDQSKRPVVANPPNPAEPAFSATSAEDIARMSAHVEAYNEIIRRKATQYGAQVVDFYNTDIFTNPATLYTDGNHPNTAGYEKITQIWFTALEPHLK